MTVALKEGTEQVLQKLSELRILSKLVVFCETIGPSLLFLLCANLLFRFSYRFRVFIKWLIQPLVQCVHLLLREIFDFMPRQPHLTYLERELDTLNRRVNLLGALWRARGNQSQNHRIAEAAVRIPTGGADQWSSVCIFLLGLCSGRIVSILAFYFGVRVGRSL